MSELRARLKATSTAFQTREKSVAELREGMRELEHDRRAAQENIQAQAQKVGQQVSGSRSSFVRLMLDCRHTQSRGLGLLANMLKTNSLELIFQKPLKKGCLCFAVVV